MPTYLPQKVGLVFLVLLLSACVIGQILGSPITLGSLLTEDQSRESSEDLSIAPIVVQPTGTSGRSSRHEQGLYSLYHPIFVTAVFRPPQA